MTLFRTGMAHLLTVVVLVCPYFCLPSVAGGMGKSLMCDCCEGGCDFCSDSAPRENQDSKDCPEQPDSPRGNGACLCHGAVMDRHVELPSPNDLSGFSFPFAELALAGEILGGYDRFSARMSRCHFPTAESGKAVRALIASLLL
jgi:hypothetical protein